MKELMSLGHNIMWIIYIILRKMQIIRGFKSELHMHLQFTGKSSPMFKLGLKIYIYIFFHLVNNKSTLCAITSTATVFSIIKEVLTSLGLVWHLPPLTAWHFISFDWMDSILLVISLVYLYYSCYYIWIIYTHSANFKMS